MKRHLFIYNGLLGLKIECLEKCKKEIIGMYQFRGLKQSIKRI